MSLDTYGWEVAAKVPSIVLAPGEHFEQPLLLKGRRKALRRNDQANSSYFSAYSLLLRLSLGGALEALQGLLHAGGDGFRAKFFQQPAPPAWWENEVSVVLDAAACRVNGRTDDAWFLLQSQREENMRVELVACVIDRFDLKSEAQSHAREVNSLASGSRPFRLRALNPDIGPLGIAFPFCEVRPDDLHRGGDNGEGTNAQTHEGIPFYKSMRTARAQNELYASNLNRVSAKRYMDAPDEWIQAQNLDTSSPRRRRRRCWPA